MVQHGQIVPRVQPEICSSWIHAAEAEARAQMGLAHERVNDANGILTQKVKDLSWDDDEEDEPPVLDADEVRQANQTKHTGIEFKLHELSLWV
eukprot:3570065-Amphidinium_carterae.1